MRARMKIRVLILVVSDWKDWAKEQMFFRTTVLKENERNIEVQYKDTDRIKYYKRISDLVDKNVKQE